MTESEMGDGPAGMDCEHAIELLPWLLNGSLEEEDRDALRRHLGDCPSCRRELAATARAGHAFAAHPPAESLVDHALGRPLELVSREALERHLAACALCREELELVRADGEPAVFSSAPPVTPAGWQGWRPLALAASLAAVLAGSGLVYQLARPDLRAARPVANVAVLELLPESYRARAGEAGGTRVDRTRAAVVLLVTDLADDHDDYRVRIVDPAGEPRWETAGVEPDENGDFTILLPAASLPPGELVVELEGLRDGAWVALERYRLGAS